MSARVHATDDKSENIRQKSMFRAAINGDDITVTYLIATGETGVNQTDHDGRTPLWWAASCGHDSVVNVLLQARTIDVNRSDKYGTSPLMTASMYYHINVVGLLIHKGNADVNQTDGKDGKGFSALDYANSEGIAKILISTGKIEVFDNITFDYSESVTPLFWAAQRGYSNIIQMLLDEDQVDYNWADSSGRTTLLLAIEYGYFRIVEQLVKVDEVDVNYKNADGHTALWIACRAGREDIVQCLLSTGRVDTSLQVEGLSFHEENLTRRASRPRRSPWSHLYSWSTRG